MPANSLRFAPDFGCKRFLKIPCKRPWCGSGFKFGEKTRFVLRKFGRFSGALENRVVFMGFHAPEKRPARPVFFGKNDPKAQESLGCGCFLLFFMIFHGVEAPAKLRRNVCFPWEI